MADVTATIAATETNNDAAEVGAVTYNPSDSARVTITEIPAQAGGAAAVQADIGE